MSNLSAISIFRLSIALLGSTAINLFAGETWGQTIRDRKDNTISREFQEYSPKTKKIQSVPSPSVESLDREKISTEEVRFEIANSEIIDSEGLANENNQDREHLDLLISSLLESLETSENNRDNSLDELSNEGNSLDELSVNRNFVVEKNQKNDAISDNKKEQESIYSPEINFTVPEEESILPSLEEVSFEAADLIVQEESEADIPNTENEIEVEQEVLGGDLNIPFTSDFGLGVFIGEPTALQGQVRAKPVLRGTRTSANLPATAYFRQKFGTTNNLLLILGGDLWVFEPKSFGVDLSYFYDKETSRVSFNIANIQTEYPAFNGGDREVNLPNGDKPIFDSLGVGVEYLQAFSPQWSVAFGVNYHKVSIRDDLFSSSLEPVDELGNRLTVSDRGQDDLFTLNISALYNNVDDSQFPTRGTRIRLGLDQAIPVGDAQIGFNRLSANLTQFIPVDLFGFTEGARTLVVNLQGGTILGQVPPYEGFTLGGGGSIRGYDVGDIGTGRSFILATAEYRFPVTSIQLLNEPLDLVGSIFVDYGSVLGTGDNILGQPGEVRQKPGDGFGYGIGLLTKTSIGLFRFELSFSDNGDSAIYFNIGERF
ncbi:MAG: BamA/TamA family outer membrane protein [Cyanobacteria bacterium SBLK]|nr:BamA/TamA family outer membrane protein [Cyanobacteria bacterium SBLK]